MGPVVRTRWLAVSQSWRAPWELTALRWQALDFELPSPKELRKHLSGWWVDESWLPPASGCVGPFEPTRAFPTDAEPGRRVFKSPLPWPAAADKAGIPPDRCTELWLLDGLAKSWASYEPSRLLRKREEEEGNLAWSTELRAIRLGELEKAFGFTEGHTAPAVPSGSLKRSGSDRVRQQLLEKGTMPRLVWPAISRALASLQTGWGQVECGAFLVQEQLNVELLTPCLGFEPQNHHSSSVANSQDLCVAGEGDNWCSEQLLVLHHLSGLSSKGSDVRLNTGAMLNPQPGRVQSIQANLWRWRLAFKWQWQLSTSAGEKQQQDSPGQQREEHINVLELRALLTATRWALRSYRSVGLTTLRLTDSRVTMGVASKYRSSSKPLQRILRKLAAIELGSSCRFCTGFIRSDWNPADGGSRDWA